VRAERADNIDEKGRCTSCGQTGVTVNIIDKEVSELRDKDIAEAYIRCRQN
jgi:hypothetical protein